MALKGLQAIAKGLLIIYSTTHNHPALLIQVSVAWHADADFGILSERLALFRAGWRYEQRYDNICFYARRSASFRLVC
jgi:hypothetical protein